MVAVTQMKNADLSHTLLASVRQGVCVVGTGKSAALQEQGNRWVDGCEAAGIAVGGCGCGSNARVTHWGIDKYLE